MPRWLRIIRGMVGTGVTFAAGVGVVGSLVGLVGMVAGNATLFDVLGTVGRLSVVAGIVGVAFSGGLAIAARGRTFNKLSLGLVTAIGGGMGLLYFLIIATNAWKVWTPRVAFLNFSLLVLMGAGAAAGTLIVARRARKALSSGDDMQSLGEGTMEETLTQREKVHESRR